MSSAAGSKIVAAVASVHQFTTVQGKAVSLRFHNDVALLRFQSLPFTSPIPLEVYRHIAYEHYTAACAETAGSLGNLDAVYWSAMPLSSSVHPVMASVEPVRSSHRTALNLKMAFWDSALRPVANILMTGGAKEPGKNVSTAVLDDFDSADTVTSTLPDCMYSVAQLEKHGKGGYFQSMVIPWSAVDTALLPVAADACNVAPPWLLADAVKEFAENIVRDTTAWKRTNLRAVAANYTTECDVELGLPFEVVSAVPKVFEQYYCPPWQREAGLPYNRGDRCLSLRMEVRQRKRLAMVGTFWFSPVHH
jgi:hypothetical protein